MLRSWQFGVSVLPPFRLKTPIPNTLTDLYNPSIVKLVESKGKGKGLKVKRVVVQLSDWLAPVSGKLGGGERRQHGVIKARVHVHSPNWLV
jgi:hypothetical protein